MQLLDVTGPLEAFNLAAQQMVDDGEAREKPYRVTVIARQRGDVTSMSGLSIRADRTLDDSLDDIDTLLIPGALTGGEPFYEDAAYQDWVRPTRFEALLDWLVENLHDELNTAGLAERACMSERSFRRKFETDLGLSPQQYVARARINRAQSLIETTALPLGDIARRCGYPSAGAMRYAFVKTLDVTPREYRRTFGGS